MAKKDEQLLADMQSKSYTVDPVSGRKTIDPSRFTILDAQIHYNDIHGLEDKSSKQSKFTKRGGLGEFGNITIEDIATNPKKFVDDLIVKAKGNEKQLIKFLQSTRLILGEIKYNLPEGSNIGSFLPNMEATDPETIRFFQNLPSTPEKTYANLAIIDEPENVRAFFNGLDAHADAVRVDAPAVDAIKFGANTGLRPSLITELKMKEVHKLSDGTYALIVDTQKVGAKDSPTKAGGRKSSKTFRIPLNDEATAIIRERIAAAKKHKLKPDDNIFFTEKVSGKDADTLKMTKLTTSHMNDVLSKINVPDGFVEDLADIDPDTNIGRVYNTLHIDKEGRPKSGTQLLRNLHTHLATRAGIDPGVIDFLQGRVSEQAIHQRLGYLTQHSRATFADNIYRNLDKFNLYFNDVGVAQRIYPAGDKGRELIEQALSERRKDIIRQGVVDLSRRTSDSDDIVRANKKEVREIASKRLGFDLEKDTDNLKAISQRFTNRADFEHFLEWSEDNTDHNLRTMAGINNAEIQYSDEASKRSTKTGLRLAAEGEITAGLQEEKLAQSTPLNPNREYDANGRPILSDDEKEKIRQQAQERGDKAHTQRNLLGRVGKRVLHSSIPFVGAAILFGEAGAEEAFREEEAGDLSISELDESIGREGKFYAQALEEAASPLPVTSYDVEMMAEESAIQKQLMQTPEYQQFERQERAEDESRAYDRELGLLDPSGGFRSVARREEERQSEKQEALAAKKEDIRAARSLRRPRDLVEEYSGFIPTT